MRFPGAETAAVSRSITGGSPRESATIRRTWSEPLSATRELPVKLAISQRLHRWESYITPQGHRFENNLEGVGSELSLSLSLKSYGLRIASSCIGSTNYIALFLRFSRNICRIFRLIFAFSHRTAYRLNNLVHFWSARLDNLPFM